MDRFDPSLIVRSMGRNFPERNPADRNPAGRILNPALADTVTGRCLVDDAQRSASGTPSGTRATRMPACLRSSRRPVSSGTSGSWSSSSRPPPGTGGARRGAVALRPGDRSDQHPPTRRRARPYLRIGYVDPTPPTRPIMPTGSAPRGARTTRAETTRWRCRLVWLRGPGSIPSRARRPYQRRSCTQAAPGPCA